MALDGMFLYALIKELQPLTGGRITKIYQPFERDIVLHIRSKGEGYRLLISADPTYPRLHLSHEQLPNPENPPLFCMVLRKHLEGGIIDQFELAEPGERIIHIKVRSRDELDNTVHKQLIVEIMGKHSNIILVDHQTGKIIDSIRHVSAEMSQYRTVWPGHPYISPPDQGKLNPFNVDQETFLKNINFNQGRLDQQLVQQFNGISPLLAKEILHRAGLPERHNVWESFQNMMAAIQNGPYEPCIMIGKERTHFYLFPLKHVASTKSVSYQQLSPMLEEYFQTKTRQSRLKQMASDLTRLLNRTLDKNKKKLTLLHQTLEESKKADHYRLYGELVTANLHRLRRGDKELEAVNYYDEEQKTITIQLEPDLSPSENAQRFFKTYNKLKTAQEKARQQIEHTQQEIYYLETLLHQLEQASWSDIEEIRQELMEQGYLRRQTKPQKKKENPPQPKQFYSSEGVPILVGGNNKQNDYLTMHLASNHDTWLHTKDIPGSHVVIRSRHVSETTLWEAANLAAYFSKARHSSQVPVDYTLIKHVRKPKGAKPGFVTYDHHKTIYVTPDQALVDKILNTK